MDFNECCRVLEIDQNLPWEEIKRSYYTLAKKYHPDKNQGNSEYEARFKEISMAFQTLEKKFLDADSSSSANGAYDSVRSKSYFYVLYRFINERIDKYPKIKQLACLLNRALKRFEKTVFQLDVCQEVSISSSVALRGGVVRIRKGKESFEVRIPPGAWDKMKLKIPEKGESSLISESRGDLNISVRIFPDCKASNKRLQSYYNLYVSKKHIQDGRACTLDTAEGPIKFFLPKNAREGQSFSLSGRISMNPSQAKTHVITLNFIEEDIQKVEEITVG